MEFDKILTKYIDEIGCSIKELSEQSKLSTAVISRYKTGNRLPKYKSTQLESLITALVKLSNNKYDENKIREDLESALIKNDVDKKTFQNNLNILITSLNINVADLSRYIGYDSSYLSKIRSGVRIPHDINGFINQVVNYIIGNYYNESLRIIINCPEKEWNNKEQVKQLLYFWISNNTYVEDYNIDKFLNKLDEFDLNDYIKEIKFDKIKVPTLPGSLPKYKTYYGLEGYKKAQLDFLKSTVLSKSMEDVFFYSNMEMTSAANDKDFTRKFMIGLAFILKKGLKLNIIHNIDRPFRELMIGLEGWIPLYMTGAISPYYFKNNSNLLYSQMNAVSGSVILNGECLSNDIKTCRMTVSNKKDDVEHYKENARQLIKKASPLIDIYTEKRKKEFYKFANSNFINDDIKNIYANLPDYTISDELLDKLLIKNNISKEDSLYIKEKINNEKKFAQEILKNNKILDEINILKESEFTDYYLDLSKYFMNIKIKYTYEDYLEHIDNLKEYKKNNKNYNYKNKDILFKNINISIISNKYVLITKNNAPIMQFVIHHPKLVSAISNLDLLSKK